MGLRGCGGGERAKELPRGGGGEGLGTWLGTGGALAKNNIRILLV